jgi:hypothetical protein
MPSSLLQKLRIKEGFTLLTINEPGDFKSKVDLPSSVKFTSKAKNYDQIHWFVQTRSQMDQQLPGVLKLLKEGILCWIYYPKGTSKLQTDLTRDKGWDNLLKVKELQWVSLISFDETWSAFAMRFTTDPISKTEKPKVTRAIFDYIDTKNKTIKLPEDFGSELKKKKKQAEFFNQLSFTNKKEYVEWIVSAKKEETRITRIKESIERLSKEWKNPSNR